MKAVNSGGPSSAHPRDGQLDGELGPVGPPGGQLDPPAQDRALARGQVVRQPAAVGLALIRRDDQLGELGADGAVARIAEDPLGGRVELDDPAQVIHGDDGVQRRLQDGRLAGGEPADRQVGEPPQRGLARDRVRRRPQQARAPAARRPRSCPPSTRRSTRPAGVRTRQQGLLLSLHLGEHPVRRSSSARSSRPSERAFTAASSPRSRRSGRGLPQRLEPGPEVPLSVGEPGLLAGVVPRQLADAHRAARRPRRRLARAGAGTTRPR